MFVYSIKAQVSVEARPSGYISVYLPYNLSVLQRRSIEVVAAFCFQQQARVDFAALR